MGALTVDDLSMLSSSLGRYVSGLKGGAEPQAIGQGLAEMGLMGAIIDEPSGGLDCGASSVVAVMRELGRGPVHGPFLSTAVLSAAAIKRAGSPAQRAERLPSIASGEQVLAFAHREPGSGHAPDWIETRAVTAPGGYRLAGTKQFVLDAPLADHFVMSAKLEDGSAALFLAEAAAPGISRHDYRSLDGKPVSDLYLRNVFLPDDSRLSGDARAAISDAETLGGLAACAEATGAAQAVNAMTLEYLKTRKQFGSTLGSFQVLQHRMVEMTVDEQQMTSVVDYVGALYDRGFDETSRWVSGAKAFCAVAGRSIGEAAVQLHGGMGMTEELDVGRYLKTLLVTASLFGDETWHAARLAARPDLSLAL